MWGLVYVQSGAIKTVVVAHEDRFARFVTEVIEWIINQAGGRLNGKRGESARKKEKAYPNQSIEPATTSLH